MSATSETPLLIAYIKIINSDLNLCQKLLLLTWKSYMYFYFNFHLSISVIIHIFETQDKNLNYLLYRF